MFRKSIEIWEKAIKIDKDFPTFYNELGKVYYFSGDFKNAEINFIYALEITPNYVEPYINLAKLYLREDRIKQARKMMSKVLIIEPTNIEVRQLFQKL